MLNPFGSSPTVAMFQLTWVTSTVVTKAQYGCAVVTTSASVGALIITLQVPVPNIVPAPAANSQLSAVNDNTYLCQLGIYSKTNGGLAPAAAMPNITYGPQNSGWNTGTAARALLGNELGIEYQNTTVGTGQPPQGVGVFMNGVVYNCYDGGPVTQGAETP
jgi:hypothetical protein